MTTARLSGYVDTGTVYRNGCCDVVRPRAGRQRPLLVPDIIVLAHNKCPGLLRMSTRRRKRRLSQPGVPGWREIRL